MTRRNYLFAAFAILLASTVNGQEPSAEISQEIEFLKSRADGFFRSLSDKTLGPERAIRELIASGPLKDRTDDINKLIDQALTLDQRFGVYTGHELASARAVGSDVVFLRYLYKGDRFPIIWYFTFYRAAPIAGVKRDWSLIALRFDAKVETLDR
ncbi:MAG: hypothetical protein SFU86_24120 [Pirellulaceae bacterium]|nr:hypothetical protein [Pirellulaceae bacterium]